MKSTRLRLSKWRRSSSPADKLSTEKYGSGVYARYTKSCKNSNLLNKIKLKKHLVCCVKYTCIKYISKQQINMLYVVL